MHNDDGDNGDNGDNKKKLFLFDNNEVAYWNAFNGFFISHHCVNFDFIQTSKKWCQLKNKKKQPKT